MQRTLLYPATRGNFMNDKTSQNSATGSLSLPSERSPIKTNAPGRTEEMEHEDDFNLDSESLDGGPSASSLILLSPQGNDESQMDLVPGPQTRPDDEGKPESSAPLVKRLSNAQRRRLSKNLRSGLSYEEARKLALLPTEQPAQSNQVAVKRQRSDDLVSPNTSTKCPQPKKLRNGTGLGSSGSKPLPKATYRDMVGAISLAVTSATHPSSLLTTDQLQAVRTSILDHIADQENPTTKPKFNGCHLKNGFLQLACADSDTVQWLEREVPSLVPWEGAQLRVYHMKDLPKARRYVGYFADSANSPDEKILRSLQNQNDHLSTKMWRVCNRKLVKTLVELVLDIDEESAKLVESRNYELHYGFGKAGIRKVSGRPNVTGGKDSVAMSGKVRAGNSSGSTLPPPRQNDPANGLKVRVGNSSGSAPQPPKRNPAIGKVRAGCSPVSALSPPKKRNPAAARTVPPKTRKSVKHQPPKSRTPRSQKPPQCARRPSVANRLLQPKPNSEEEQLPSTSQTAVGSRQPIPGSSSDPDKDGNFTAK
ncbi:uncharacterized protein LOC129719116 [Wyeomyia smithii]|uniref:uncharacterized protein LOC129719116 n=1 Tax=Wyeomyia smithii TaxID=174621 RepID=UPI002467EB24|nr:uncharacterized protein LOC129719116 [Wyeomyia smithii]